MSDFPTVSIPSSWIWCRIQDVATTATGGTPSRSISEYFGGSIPWVKSGELGDGHVFETEETLSELGLKSSNAKLFPKGTLCIALYGATVGKLGILEVDAATNQAVCGVFLPDEVHRDFAFYYLASIRRHLIEQGKGGAQSNISNGLVRETSIPIAPLNEQQRIVAKIEELFSDLDAGVAALKRAKANLKRYRASVLKAAVEGKLTEQWRAKHPAKEPASALLARILKERRLKWEVDQLAKFAAAKKEPPKNWRDKYKEPAQPDTNGLPELPEGWCWASVEQLVSEDRHSLAIGPFGSNLKVPDYRESGVPLIFVRNIRSGMFGGDGTKFVTAAKAIELNAHSTEAGDILITKMGEPPGDACLYPQGSPKAIITADCIKVRLHPLLPDARLVVFAINSDTVRKQVVDITKGVAQQKVNLERFSTIAIPLSPRNEQHEIISEVATKLSQIDAAEMQIQHGLLRAARLRQSILKRAFEGKLVPQDPKDEPATALLKKLAQNQLQSGNSVAKPKARHQKAQS